MYVVVILFCTVRFQESERRYRDENGRSFGTCRCAEDLRDGPEEGETCGHGCWHNARMVCRQIAPCPTQRMGIIALGSKGCRHPKPCRSCAGMTALSTCAMALRTATIVQGFGSHGCPHCFKNAMLSADKVSPVRKTTRRRRVGY